MSQHFVTFTEKSLNNGFCVNFRDLLHKYTHKCVCVCGNIQLLVANINAVRIDAIARWSAQLQGRSDTASYPHTYM